MECPTCHRDPRASGKSCCKKFRESKPSEMQLSKADLRKTRVTQSPGMAVRQYERMLADDLRALGLSKQEPAAERPLLKRFLIERPLTIVDDGAIDRISNILTNIQPVTPTLSENLPLVCEICSIRYRRGKKQCECQYCGNHYNNGEPSCSCYPTYDCPLCGECVYKPGIIPRSTIKCSSGHAWYLDERTNQNRALNVDHRLGDLERPRKLI